jgi:hypothetical protein
LQQFDLLLGPHEAFGKSRGVQGRPKAVSRPRKMMAGPGRIQARVNAAEKDAQAVIDEVRHGFVRRGKQLPSSWFSSIQPYLVTMPNLIAGRTWPRHPWTARQTSSSFGDGYISGVSRKIIPKSNENEKKEAERFFSQLQRAVPPGIRF